jgi:membrane-bound lytic murein transglycosylase MltF
MLAGFIASVIKPVHSGREILYVIRDAVRLKQVGRVPDNLRPECELSRDIQLPWADQQRDVRSLRQSSMFFRRGDLDVDQPRVRVLGVIDRVLVALGYGELEVELDGRIRGAL